MLYWIGKSSGFFAIIAFLCQISFLIIYGLGKTSLPLSILMGFASFSYWLDYLYEANKLCFLGFPLTGVFVWAFCSFCYFPWL